MKIKLAAIALIASVALSCNTSFGCDLLDKMLGRAGCSSCQAPKAPSCGCGGGGGLMDKIMSRAEGCGCAGNDMLTYDANMSCGPEPQLCGNAPVSDCGCGAPAAVDCGCSAPAPVADCGCSAPAPAPVADCGCSAPAPAPVADCGCAAPAPVADCGCGAPAAGLNLLKKKPCSFNLFSKFKKPGCGAPAALAPVADCGCSAPAPVADCGCEAPAPVADCGCSAPAPVADCGCGSPAPAIGGGCGLGQKLSSGLFSKFKKPGCGCAAPVADCGCSAPAPAVSDCGCSAPVAAPCGSAIAQCGCNGGGRPELSLLDRLRGNRIPRTKAGAVIGAGCNDGCNPPCPAQPAADCGCGAPAYEAAPCTSCSGGEGAIIYGDAQPVESGCSSCGGSSAGQIIYGDAVAAPMATMGSEAAPVVPDSVPEASTTEGVIESGDGSAAEAVQDAVKEASPVVDPGAFIPARRTTIGS